jgi:hypothetical protein
MTLDEAQPDMLVEYRPANHPTRNAGEDGIVSSKNDRFVFVKFIAQIAKLGREGTTAQACDPEDLVKL